METAIKATFWIVTFGGLGYTLLNVVKPDDSLLKKFDEGSKHTDTRKLSKQAISILKDAANQDSELNKKLENLIKK